MVVRLEYIVYFNILSIIFIDLVFRANTRFWHGFLPCVAVAHCEHIQRTVLFTSLFYSLLLCEKKKILWLWILCNQIPVLFSRLAFPKEGKKNMISLIHLDKRICKLTAKFVKRLKLIKTKVFFAFRHIHRLSTSSSLCLFHRFSFAHFGRHCCVYGVVAAFVAHLQTFLFTSCHSSREIVLKASLSVTIINCPRTNYK